MYTLLHLAVLTGTVLLLAMFLPGVRIKQKSSALIVAVVFSLLNWVVGWLVKTVLVAVLLVPAILTLGLAYLVLPFVANVILLWVTDKLLDAFELRDSKTLLIAATAITVVNGLFQIVIRR